MIPLRLELWKTSNNPSRTWVPVTWADHMSFLQVVGPTHLKKLCHMHMTVFFTIRWHVAKLRWCLKPSNACALTLKGWDMKIRPRFALHNRSFHTKGSLHHHDDHTWKAINLNLCCQTPAMVENCSWKNGSRWSMLCAQATTGLVTDITWPWPNKVIQDLRAIPSNEFQHRHVLWCFRYVCTWCRWFHLHSVWNPATVWAIWAPSSKVGVCKRV